MRIGFIGTGNMGMAIIKGYLKTDPNAADGIYAFDTDAAKLEALSKALCINSCKSAVELVQSSDVVMLAIKPNIYEKVLKDISNKRGSYYSIHGSRNFYRFYRKLPGKGDKDHTNNAKHTGYGE
jgi:pyrroline-5-carboxylate reductase